MASTYAPRHNQAAQRKLEAKQRKAKAKARRKSKKLSPTVGTLAAVTLVVLSLTHSEAAFMLLSVVAFFAALWVAVEGHTRPEGRHVLRPEPIDPEAEAGAIVEAAEQILVEEARNTPVDGAPEVSTAHVAPKRRKGRFLFVGTLFYLALTAISHVSSKREQEAKQMQKEIDYQLWEGWRKPPYGSE